MKLLGVGCNGGLNRVVTEYWEKISIILEEVMYGYSM